MELALRVGGSRAGLLNASLVRGKFVDSLDYVLTKAQSNTVTLVVAVRGHYIASTLAANSFGLSRSLR